MVKKAKTKPKKSSVTNGRVRQLSKKDAKLKAKKEAGKQPPIPGSFRLVAQVFEAMKTNWKVLGGIVLVYAILNAVFASNLLSDLNTSVNNIQHTHNLSAAFNGYGSLLGGSSGGSQTGSITQSVLLVLESLVIIWALRQLLASQKIGVKQAYYHSMTPLVPFLLVIAMIIVQLLPLTLGSALLALILSSTVSSGSLVTLIFGIFFVALACWTLYMVSASIFGLYIVTLPDMQPRQALRSAKNLVHFRRWIVLRRLLFLPIFILLVLGLVTVPLIVVASFLVVPVFFVLLMLTVLFAHTYLYSLYRGLIA